MFHVVTYSKQKGFLDENAEPSESVSPNDPAWAREVELKSVYMQAVEAYKRELAPAYPELTISPGKTDSPGNEDSYDNEDDETIVFDEQLYTTLFDIYVVEGWKGVYSVEAALLKRAPPRDDVVLPGGTQVSKWVKAKKFFYITRNLLVLLIRDALFNIERAAAGDIIGRLSDASIAIEQAWTIQFRFNPKRTSPAQRVQKIGDEAYLETPSPVTTFEMGNSQLATTLLRPMTEAVEQKLLLDDALRRLPQVKEERDQALARANLQQYDVNEQIGKAERLELEAAALERVDERAMSLYSKAHKLIEMKSPLALLALDSLPKGFQQPQMENSLGKILDTLRNKLDELGGAIDPGKSHSAACLKAIGLTPETKLQEITPSIVAPQGLEVPPQGLEALVIEAAIAGAPKDAGWFPLLNEATLHRLTQSGGIAADSFEYIVYFHYVSFLMERIEALRAQEEMSKAFWNTVNILAAGLSLASLLTPVSAPVAAPLRFLSLALMANAVHSVVDELARFDKDLSQTLIQPDTLGVAGLARIGELVAMRAELVGNLVLHVAIEVLLSLPPARFVVLRRLLLARGYYQDVETLLDDG